MPNPYHEPKTTHPVFVEFTGLSVDRKVATMLHLRRCLGEDFRKWRKQFGSGLSIERADLDWRKTKDVLQQWYSETQ
jgi:hypothetical protein